MNVNTIIEKKSLMKLDLSPIKKLIEIITKIEAHITNMLTFFLIK